MRPVLKLLKTIWRRWKKAVHQLNAGISFFLMTIVYVTAMAPVALYFRVFRPDPIDRGLGDLESQSYWLSPRLGSEDIRRAQRPW